MLVNFSQASSRKRRQAETLLCFTCCQRLKRASVTIQPTQLLPLRSRCNVVSRVRSGSTRPFLPTGLTLLHAHTFPSTPQHSTVVQYIKCTSPILEATWHRREWRCYNIHCNSRWTNNLRSETLLIMEPSTQLLMACTRNIQALCGPRFDWQASFFRSSLDFW